MSEYCRNIYIYARCLILLEVRSLTFNFVHACSEIMSYALYYTQFESLAVVVRLHQSNCIKIYNVIATVLVLSGDAH